MDAPSLGPLLDALSCPSLKLCSRLFDGFPLVVDAIDRFRNLAPICLLSAASFSGGRGRLPTSWGSTLGPSRPCEVQLNVD